MRGVFKAGLYWSCTAAVLSLSLLSCSASKRLTKTQNVDAQMCPPPLKKQTQRVAGEHLAWCLTPDGHMNGPFQARYEDGRPKAFSKLKSGRLDGVYRAWHPNGRRAVRQTYRNGQLTGRRTIWPPNGPRWCVQLVRVVKCLRFSGDPSASPTTFRKSLCKNSQNLTAAF